MASLTTVYSVSVFLASLGSFASAFVSSMLCPLKTSPPQATAVPPPPQATAVPPPPQATAVPPPPQATAVPPPEPTTPPTTPIETEAPFSLPTSTA